MSRDYDSRDIEFSTAVASAAFAIYSLEESVFKYQKTMNKDQESLWLRNKSMKDDSTRLPSSGTRRFSNETTGKASKPRPIWQDQKVPANNFPGRPILMPKRTDVVTKADVWERTQKEKIKKRYEMMKSRILTWEKEKKRQAKLRMEKKKGELEFRIALNQKHYGNKIARIEQITEGAKAQLEEKRRNEENEAKESAKRIRSTGRIPVTCFCFTCY